MPLMTAVQSVSMVNLFQCVDVMSYDVERLQVLSKPQDMNSMMILINSFTNQQF